MQGMCGWPQDEVRSGRGLRSGGISQALRQGLEPPSKSTGMLPQGKQSGPSTRLPGPRAGTTARGPHPLQHSEEMTDVPHPARSHRAHLSSLPGTLTLFGCPPTAPLQVLPEVWGL